MIHKVFRFSFFVFIIAALSACARFHSVKSAPSNYDQCVALKHKMLFLFPGRKNENEWTIQTKKRQYLLAYKKLNCDIILHNKKYKIKKHY